ncbi:unnamed protein product, partial [Polarella glacialis]
MTAMVNSGKLKEGLQLLNRMDEVSADLDLPAMLVAIRLQGAVGNHEGALALLRRAAVASPGSGEEPVAPVEAYNACITALGKAGLSAAAAPKNSAAEGGQRSAASAAVQELLCEMSQRRVALTRVSFGAALQAQSRSSAWQESLHLLLDMAVHGLQPDAQAFMAAIGACGRAGKWHTALALLSQAEAAGAADLRCRNAAIAACGRAGLWREALHELANLGELGTTVSWNSGITACAEASEWPQALSLLWRLCRSQAQIASDLAGVELAQGQLQAPQVLRPDTVSFNAALAACRNAGRWREVLGVLDSMAAEGAAADDSTLSTVAAACERAGVPELGLELWRRLWAQTSGAGSSGSAASSAPAYNAALRSAASSSLWRQVLEMVREMADKGVPRGRLSCRAVLRACDLSGRTREAAATLPLFRGWLEEEELERLAAGLEQRLLMQPGPEAASGESATTTSRQHSPAAAGFQWLHLGPVPAPEPGLLPQLAETPIDLAQLRAVVCRALEGAELWPLGSNAEGLRGPSSDADATIVLPEGLAMQQLPFEQARDLQRQALRTLRTHLVQTAGFDNLELVLEAKRPILRLTLPCGTPTDVSVENRAGARKSSLVAALIHGASHPALRQACFLLKDWAKQRGVYGQHEGFPSGLGFACLGIFAAQCLEPLVTFRGPNLVEAVPAFADPSLTAGRSSGWRPQAWEAALGEDRIVPQLLHAIFAFYAEELDWEAEVVSIRSACRMKRRADQADSILSIEDPVLTDLDLARPYMDRARSEVLHAEFRRAQALTRSGDWAGAFLAAERETSAEALPEIARAFVVLAGVSDSLSHRHPEWALVLEPDLRISGVLTALSAALLTAGLSRLRVLLFLVVASLAAAAAACHYVGAYLGLGPRVRFLL